MLAVKSIAAGMALVSVTAFAAEYFVATDGCDGADGSAARLREISCADGCITRDFEGCRHSVGVTGNVESTDAGFLIAPAGNEIVFRF